MPIDPSVENARGNISIANVRTFDDEPYIIPASAYRDHSTPVHLYDPASPGRVTLGNSTAELVIPVPARYRDRLTSFTVYLVKNSDTNNTITARLERSRNSDGAVTTVATKGNGTPGPGATSITPDAPFAEDVTDEFSYHILIYNSDATPSAVDRVLFTVVNRCSTLG